MAALLPVPFQLTRTRMLQRNNNDVNLAFRIWMVAVNNRSLHANNGQWPCGTVQMQASHSARLHNLQILAGLCGTVHRVAASSSSCDGKGHIILSTRRFCMGIPAPDRFSGMQIRR